jgi:hypothetical protein
MSCREKVNRELFFATTRHLGLSEILNTMGSCAPVFLRAAPRCAF